MPALAPTPDRTPQTREMPRRIAFVSALTGTLLLLGLALVFVRVIQLQIRPSANLIRYAPLTVSTHLEMGLRGDLLDRRGRILATSRMGRRLFVDPSYVDDPYTIGIDLAQLLDADALEFDRKIQARLGKRYAPLIPLLNDEQVEAVRTARFKGVGLEPVLVRHQPQQAALAAALIGTVGTDHEGRTGMEYLFDHLLLGTSGSLTYLRDVHRRAMWIEPDDYRRSWHGTNLRLSLDIEIQRIALEELRKQVEAYNAGGGRLIVLDPASGEILALCDILRHRDGFEDYAPDPDRQLNPAWGRNRCVTDPYEPGSTFKPIVWAAVTQLNLADPDEVIDTHQGIYRTDYGRIVHDSYPYDHLTWEQVLIKSSNIGMATVAQRMTYQQLQDAVRRFGFGRPTGSGFPGESPGIVTPPGKWTNYSQTSVSFGHEIAVTPLQMVRAFSAFARDGTLPTIQLLAVDARQPVRLRAIIEQRALPESIAMQTRLILRRVMQEGTGRKAEKGARYRMFGKSGTAQLPDAQAGGYHDDRYVISFIAGAPLDDPRIVVLCIIEDPDRSIGHLGGAICGPVVRNVVNRALEYLGVSPELTPNPNR